MRFFIRGSAASIRRSASSGVSQRVRPGGSLRRRKRRGAVNPSAAAIFKTAAVGVISWRLIVAGPAVGYIAAAAAFIQVLSISVAIVRGPAKSRILRRYRPSPPASRYVKAASAKVSVAARPRL